MKYIAMQCDVMQCNTTQYNAIWRNTMQIQMWFNAMQMQFHAIQPHIHLHTCTYKWLVQKTHPEYTTWYSFRQMWPYPDQDLDEQLHLAAYYYRPRTELQMGTQRHKEAGRRLPQVLPKIFPCLWVSSLQKASDLLIDKMVIISLKNISKIVWHSRYID